MKALPVIITGALLLSICFWAYEEEKKDDVKEMILKLIEENKNRTKELPYPNASKKLYEVQKEMKEIEENLKPPIDVSQEIWKKQKIIAIESERIYRINKRIIESERIRLRSLEINSTLPITLKYEKQVKDRGFINRILFGGDKEAGRMLKKMAEKCLKKIELINQSVNKRKKLPLEIKKVVWNSLEKIKTEEERIKALGEKEIKENGILGGLIKSFRSLYSSKTANEP